MQPVRKDARQNMTHPADDNGDVLRHLEATGDDLTLPLHRRLPRRKVNRTPTRSAIPVKPHFNLCNNLILKKNKVSPICILFLPQSGSQKVINLVSTCEARSGTLANRSNPLISKPCK